MRTTSRTTGLAITLAAGLLATGCAQTSSEPAAHPAANSTAGAPDPALNVPAWYAAGGDTLTTKLGADLSTISADATSNDTQAMQTHCDALALDVGAATNYPPIPDAEAQQHWSAALNSLTAGSQDCSEGAANGDADQLGKSATEIRTAGNEMAKATARINALNDQA